MATAMAGAITRRHVLWAVTAGAGVRLPPERPLAVPVLRVMDKRTRCTPQELRRFWWSLWPQAARDFAAGGIHLQCRDAQGEIKRSPGGRPIFAGIERGIINLVLTDHIPADWDQGRGLAGVTTVWHGCCLCVIAIRNAHGNQFPFLSVNTCVHELLHALLEDIFVSRPTWYQSGEREWRIDWYATQLWLFGDGAAIRRSAEVCLKRLRSAAGSET